MSGASLTDWAEAASAPPPSARPGAALKAATSPPRVTVGAGHRLAFQAMMASTGDEFGIVACKVNGVPSALIAMGQHLDEHRMEIMPLFVAICPGMRITGPDDELIWEHAKS